MAQTIEELQVRLNDATQSIAFLTAEVDDLRDAVANTAGTQGYGDNPLVRLDFMNHTIDADRVRLDALEEGRFRVDILEGERLAMSEQIDTLAAQLERSVE